jgi:hypothetical protein
VNNSRFLLVQLFYIEPPLSGFVVSAVQVKTLHVVFIDS